MPIFAPFNPSNFYVNPQTGYQGGTPTRFFGENIIMGGQPPGIHGSAMKFPTTTPQTGTQTGFLGATQPSTTSATTTPKLDLLKVEKNPELNQTLRNLTSDLNKLRTEQNTAADAFAKLNSELFTPDFLGRERSKFDLTPVTNQLASNRNQYQAAVNEGLGLALDRANRSADLSRLGQTAGGGSLGDSSYNRLLQGQMFREAATPFLGAVADRERADAMWLEQMKQSQVGRDLALTQAYLNQQSMPAQLRAQFAGQQGSTLGNLSNILDRLNFLGVGGQNPMSSPFIGASPNVPYYPAPSPARRGTGSVVEAEAQIPEWLKRQAPGVTTASSPSGPITAAQRAAYHTNRYAGGLAPNPNFSWGDPSLFPSETEISEFDYFPTTGQLEEYDRINPPPIDYATEFE